MKAFLLILIILVTLSLAVFNGMLWGYLFPSETFNQLGMVLSLFGGIIIGLIGGFTFLNVYNNKY